MVLCLYNTIHVKCLYITTGKAAMNYLQILTYSILQCQGHYGSTIKCIHTKYTFDITFVKLSSISHLWNFHRYHICETIIDITFVKLSSISHLWNYLRYQICEPTFNITFVKIYLQYQFCNIFVKLYLSITNLWIYLW